MVNKIFLNNTAIMLDRYEEEKVNGLYKISIEFKVTSEDYHEVTSLLYKGTFNVKIPEKGLEFKGAIQQYSTSITNLYETGQVGDFKLTLLEVKEGS